MVKKLSEFKGADGIVVAAKLFSVIMTILADKRNMAMKDEKSPVKMFAAFMEHSPKEMLEIFAILSEKDPATFTCDGAEAMVNMLHVANDPVLMSLFISQSQKGEARSSGSASENTGA